MSVVTNLEQEFRQQVVEKVVENNKVQEELEHSQAVLRDYVVNHYERIKNTCLIQEIKEHWLKQINEMANDLTHLDDYDNSQFYVYNNIIKDLMKSNDELSKLIDDLAKKYQAKLNLPYPGDPEFAEGLNYEKAEKFAFKLLSDDLINTIEANFDVKATKNDYGLQTELNFDPKAVAREITKGAEK